MKRAFILILTTLLLIIPSVCALDYIKSVNEIPIKQGYEIILNYPVLENQIYAQFINDTTHKFTDVVINDYYEMPDGTIKIKTNYVEADRIIFYYADTFSDWSLRAMDSNCDFLDLQHPSAPDCIYERGYPVSMENVRFYEDSGEIHMDLKNVGKNPVDIAGYRFYLNWGGTITRSIGDFDKGEKIILNPGDTYHYLWGEWRYKDNCNQNFFIGLVDSNGANNAIAIFNRKLECLEYKPTCGDLVCSKYEKFMNCSKDCDNPINLNATEGKPNGIYFDYSYLGDNCIYQVSNPSGEIFTSKESLDNYNGKNLTDTNVRYNNQITNLIKEMFSSYISGNYSISVICYEKGFQISKQSNTLFICADCLINGECISKNSLKDNYYCTKDGVTEKVGFFKKLYLQIKLFFTK